MIDPSKDGVDHINVYSKGKTELGRLLSNFAHTPFTCEDGVFASIEGYWYWLSCTDIERDKLRLLHGAEAKKIGRQLRGEDWPKDPEFQSKIIRAMSWKLTQTKDLDLMLGRSTLPFKHYYLYGSRVKDLTSESQWMLDHWENWRDVLRKDLF